MYVQGLSVGSGVGVFRLVCVTGTGVPLPVLSAVASLFGVLPLTGPPFVLLSVAAAVPISNAVPFSGVTKPPVAIGVINGVSLNIAVIVATVIGDGGIVVRVPAPLSVGTAACVAIIN